MLFEYNLALNIKSNTMKTKMIILLGVVFLLSASTLLAQGQGPKKEHKAKLEEVKKELNLTEEQAAEWDKIHRKYGDQMREMRDQNRENREKTHDQMMQMRDAMDQELSQVLTPGQLQQYQSIREEKMQQMRKQGRERGADMAEMREELNLTAEQEEQMKNIKRSAREDMQKIRSDESLSEEEKRTASKKIKEESKAQVMAILNSEQQAIFMKQMEERKQRREGR